MKKIIWKKNKIVSIKLKKNIFVLAQMIESPYIIFFNFFNHDNIFKDIHLSLKDVLFCHGVTSQFLKYSSITEVNEIEFLYNYSPPNIWIISGDFEQKTLWRGTKNEITFIMSGMKNSLLVEKNILNHKENIHSSGIYRRFIKDLSEEDYEEVKDYELTTIEIYPNLNERLYLCHKLKKKVDPEKEIMFNRELALEYKTYIDIISGIVKINDLGY